MPFHSEYVDPEVILTHAGVIIYRTYKDDDIAQPSEYWVATSRYHSYEYGAQDIRDLPNPHAHNLDTPEGVVALLTEAIDAGIVTPGDDDRDGFVY